MVKSFFISTTVESLRIKKYMHTIKGSASFDHGPIDHSHSQQPVPRGFPLFKRCEWLVVNRTVVKRNPPTIKNGFLIMPMIYQLTLHFYIY